MNQARARRGNTHPSAALRGGAAFVELRQMVLGPGQNFACPKGKLNFELSHVEE
jgi:hypothetical protein